MTQRQGKIGFTGTRGLLTSYQVSALQDVFQYRRPAEVHHGDCVGADALFHAFAVNEPEIKIVIHPPLVDTYRARCAGRNVEVLAPQHYLVRNHAIVDDTDLLVAAPSTDREQLRSGTWATVRYALKQGRRVMLLQPNGTSRWLDTAADLSGRRR